LMHMQNQCSSSSKHTLKRICLVRRPQHPRPAGTPLGGNGKLTWLLVLRVNIPWCHWEGQPLRPKGVLIIRQADTIKAALSPDGRLSGVTTRRACHAATTAHKPGQSQQSGDDSIAKRHKQHGAQVQGKAWGCKSASSAAGYNTCTGHSSQLHMIMVGTQTSGASTLITPCST
jgi:hypothetical protein